MILLDTDHCSALQLPLLTANTRDFGLVKGLRTENWLYKLTALLETEALPYAIIGAFALLEYGHKRTTVDVDLVMREEDLQEFKRRHLALTTLSPSIQRRAILQETPPFLTAD